MDGLKSRHVMGVSVESKVSDVYVWPWNDENWRMRRGLDLT